MIMENFINDDMRIFFTPGDIVIVRHASLENRPKMQVIEKVTRSIRTKDGDTENMFLGIKCRWFDKNQVLREAVFSTKDIQKL